MPGALYNPDNVVTGHAIMYLKPWVLATPAVLPADTAVLFDDTTWLAASPVWLKAGATNEGFKINVEASTTQITIEEQSTPVDETLEGKSITIEAELAEDTMEAMKYSWGGGVITTVAAASAVAGTKKMTLDDTVLKWAVALETRNFNGFARRILIPKTSMFGSGQVSFRRAADKRMYPIRVSSLCKPSDIQIVDVTAAALP